MNRLEIDDSSAFNIIRKPQSQPQNDGSRSAGPPPFPRLESTKLASLAARTAAFLPHMAKANQELEQQQANGENVDMEQNPSEEHIKMTLLLGVLEQEHKVTEDNIVIPSGKVTELEIIENDEF